MHGWHAQRLGNGEVGDPIIKVTRPFRCFILNVDDSLGLIVYILLVVERNAGIDVWHLLCVLESLENVDLCCAGEDCAV